MSLSWQVLNTAEADLVADLSSFINNSDGGHFLQYPGWSTVSSEETLGESILVGRASGAVRAVATMRLRRVAGLGPRVAYVDRGPVVADEDSFAKIVPHLVELAKEQGAMSLRLQPYMSRSSGPFMATLKLCGFTHASVQHGYGVTMMTELRDDPDDLLKCFRRDARASIRKACKFGLQVAVPEQEDLSELDNIYQGMIQRKGATAIARGFFLRLGNLLAHHPQRGFCLVSRFEGRLLGGIVVMLNGKRALYAFGASRPPERGLPRTHLLHFEAMKTARARGSTLYDMGGCSAGSGREGQRDTRQNINLFKASFGGVHAPLLLEHEVVLKPGLYRVVDGLRWLAARKA